MSAEPPDSAQTAIEPVPSRLLGVRAARTLVLRPALAVPRVVLGALADIRTIAESTRAIPVLANQLTTIQERVASLDEEVVRMRQAVEAIGVDVVGVRESTEPLSGHLDGVRQSIAPLQRLGRLGRRTGARRRPPARPG
jgi:hypothetical protein